MLVDEIPVEHQGVKGMKWGVRKEAKRSAKADAKWEANVNTTKTFIAVHNSAAEKTNRLDVDRINNKPEYKNINLHKDPHSALAQKYLKEHEDAFNKRMQESFDEIVGTNPSGTAKVHILETGQPVFRKLSHSEEDLGIELTYTEDGKISGWVIPTQPLIQSATEVLEGILSHHGVKGMKWGVRRQGKRPASEDAERAKTFKKQIKRSGTKSLSNKELQDLVTRMNLEQQYSTLTIKNSPKRFEKAHKALKSALGVGKTANEAIKFANSPSGRFLRDQMKNAAKNRARASGRSGNTHRYSQAIASLTP